MFIKDTKKLAEGSRFDWLKLVNGSRFGWLVAKIKSIQN